MEALLQELSRLRHGLRAYLGNRSTVAAALGVASLSVIAFVYGVTGKPFGNARTIHSIAVLSLDNLSGDPAQAYFADAMTEELTTSLARIGSLKIISRTSAMQYRGSQKPLKQIALELGVDAVVEGSVSRFGDKVRITAQLIDARTDRHLWADSYEKAFGEVLGIQSSVALEIARQVESKLSPTEETGFRRHVSVNPEAYEAYLQGRYHLSRQDPEALKKGLAEFQHAIDIDPSYAPAYAGLADTFNLFANYGVMSPGEAFPRAKAAAQKSIQLDETLAEPHASLGFSRHHFDWDWRGAEAEYKRAIELSPSYASAHARYAEYLSTASRHEQAISEIRKAHELDPLSRFISTNIGRILYYAHRYDEAIKELLQTVELDPNAGHAHLLLGLAYEQKGMNTEAIEEYTKAQAMLRWPYSLSLAHLYAAVGRRADSEAILRQAENRPDDWYWVAGVQAALGNKDAAFDYLDKVYDARNFFLCFLDVDPYFDALHSDPRFAILMRRVGIR
jgi:TolB-like protein/Tfp pilus assembly protein PilF